MARQDYGGTSDDMISVGRAIVEALASLRTALIDVARPDAPGSFVSGVQNGGTSLVIGIPADADLVEIDMNVSPGVDASNFNARFTQGGVPVSGASDYSWANLRGGVETPDFADDRIQIATGLDTTLGSSFSFRLWRPNATNIRKFLKWNGLVVDSAGTAVVTDLGGGRMAANSNPIDGIEFFFTGAGTTINGLQWSARYNGFTS